MPAARRLTGDEHRNRDVGRHDVRDAARLRNGDGGLRVRRADDGARQDRHGEGHVQQLDEHTRHGRVSEPGRVLVLADGHRPDCELRDLPNTATIVETGQSASASVTVCASTPAPSPLTGALTMGFWQNKNGQGIIAAANQANLLAFLKGYAPFSDATAPLTGYATTIIKAANASGSSMNPMLKAQMLATALDVYFSDPARGGTRSTRPRPSAACGST